jgi:hypothetical protein
MTRIKVCLFFDHIPSLNIEPLVRLSVLSLPNFTPKPQKIEAIAILV